MIEITNRRRERNGKRLDFLAKDSARIYRADEPNEKYMIYTLINRNVRNKRARGVPDLTSRYVSL